MAQQQVDDIIMSAAGGLMQQGLAVPVPDMESCTILNQSLSEFLKTSVDGQAKRVVSGIDVHQSRL
jgi:hypothetical protein